MVENEVNKLEQLIQANKMDEALDYVGDKNAHYIASLLQEDTIEQSPEQFDVFIRRLCSALESPYAKADAVYHLSDLYLTVLSYLPHAFFTYRNLTLSGFAALTPHMAEHIRQTETMVGNPDQTLPPATYARLKGYAEELGAMSFGPTPKESAPHETEAMAMMKDFGEDPTEWLRNYRGNR